MENFFENRGKNFKIYTGPSISFSILANFSRGPLNYFVRNPTTCSASSLYLLLSQRVLPRITERPLRGTVLHPTLFFVRMFVFLTFLFVSRSSFDPLLFLRRERKNQIAACLKRAQKCRKRKILSETIELLLWTNGTDVFLLG